MEFQSKVRVESYVYTDWTGGKMSYVKSTKQIVIAHLNAEKQTQEPFLYE